MLVPSLLRPLLAPLLPRVVTRTVSSSPLSLLLQQQQQQQRQPSCGTTPTPRVLRPTVARRPFTLGAAFALPDADEPAHGDRTGDDQHRPLLHGTRRARRPPLAAPSREAAPPTRAPAAGDARPDDVGSATTTAAADEAGTSASVPFRAFTQLQPQLLANLARLGFNSAFEVQAKTLPVTLAGRDALVRAMTGSGKTLAFLLPILNGILASPRPRSDGARTACRPLAVVLTPTRELCLQIESVCRTLLPATNIACAAIYGGSSYERQQRALARQPQIVIGTPGRMMDAVENRRLDLSRMQLLVLDEADKMLEQDFREQLEAILQQAPSSKDRQTLLFSATLSPEIRQIAHSYMREPTTIDLVGLQLKAMPANIKHRTIDVSALTISSEELIAQIVKHYQPKRVIVFCTYVLPARPPRRLACA